MSDQVKSVIAAFMNQPFMLVLEGVFPLILTAVVIFSRTSVGRRVLNFLKELCLSLKKKVEDALNEIKLYFEKTDAKVKELEEQYEKKALDLQKQYDVKVAAAVSTCNYYVEALFDICGSIPNTIVQNKVQELKSNYETKKDEIRNVVGVIYQDFEESVELTTEEVKAYYESKIQDLYKQINELQTGIKLIGEGENNGSREETENADTTSETPQVD